MNTVSVRAAGTTRTGALRRAAPIAAGPRCLLLLFVAVQCAGCQSESGPTRYRVSGKITFAGQPVPYGEVLFTPDSSKGNSGPQGIATIEDGQYDTAGSRAPGVGGGPTIVEVTALTAPGGKLLGEYRFSIDLPKADSQHDIDIPASAGKKAGGPEI